MTLWTPPGYLSLDAMFSRLGSEIFGAQWTGNEALAGWVQPPEYWRDREQERKAEARRQKEHAERAARAAVSISGGPYGPPSRHEPTRSREVSVPPNSADPDWRSEEYATKYREDQEAAQRYRRVALQIIENCWSGIYLAVYRNPDGQFGQFARNTIQSEFFQKIIVNPGDPERERIVLVSRADNLAIQTTTRRQHKARSEKGHWLLARSIAFDWLENEGAPMETGDQAKLEKHIADCLAKRKVYPATSTIRAYVVQWVASYRDGTLTR